MDKPIYVAAQEQIEWEAQARRDYERRRRSDVGNNQETRQAGRPAAEADRTEPQTTEGHLTNSVRDGPPPEEPGANQ